MQATPLTITPNSDLVSAPEAAAILGVSRTTAWSYMIRGRLRSREVAGRFVALRSDVEQLRAELDQRAGSGATLQPT